MRTTVRGLLLFAGAALFAYWGVAIYRMIDTYGWFIGVVIGGGRLLLSLLVISWLYRLAGRKRRERYIRPGP